MNGARFTNMMESAFRPFLSELGFHLQPIHISGRLYRATFSGSRHTLLITFEPEDENTTVMLLTNGDDDLKAIDDPSRTPRLANLNSRYMPNVSADERSQNETYFSQFTATDRPEKLLLKCAKDLRLVLPLHLAA